MTASSAVPPDAPPVAPAAPPPRARFAFWRAHGLEWLGAWLFTGFAVWPLLRRSRLVTSFDTIAYSTPNTRVSFSALRHGHLAQWNDALFGGIFHLANAQTAVLYPVKWPFAFFGISPHRAVVLITAFHAFLLAAGMIVLLGGTLRLRAPAALIGAVVIIGSGMTSFKIIQYEQFLVLAWTPWLLAAIEWAITATRRRGRTIAAVALATAMTVTAGHPQTVSIVAGLAVGWTVFRLLAHHRPRRLLDVGGAALLGGGVAAAHLLPALAVLNDSAMVGTRTLQSVGVPGFVVHPSLMPSTILGDVFAKDLAAASQGFEFTSFVGAAATVLALVALVNAFRRRRWEFGALIVTGLVAIGLALGPRSPLFRFAFHHIPGFQEQRVPGRWMIDVSFVLAILAAFGIDAVLRREVDRRVALGALGAVVVGIAVTAIGPFDLPETKVIVAWLVAGAVTGGVVALYAVRNRGAVIAATALLAVIVIAELGMSARHNAVRTYDYPATIDNSATAPVRYLEHRPERVIAITGDKLGDPAYLIAGLRPNINATFKIPSIDGYDGGAQVTKRWVDTMRAFTNGSFNPDLTMRAQARLPLDAALYARYGVRWALIDTETIGAAQIVPGWIGPVRVSGTLELWENPSYRGRAFVYYDTKVVARNDGPALARLDESALSQVALVDPSGPRLQCDAPCPRRVARLRRTTPEHLTITARASRRGLVMVPEQFDDGWHATVDGRGTRVVPVDGYVLGVAVPRGRHVVELRYTARGLHLGLVVTAVSLALVVLLWLGFDDRVRGWWTRRRQTVSSRRDDAASAAST